MNKPISVLLDPVLRATAKRRAAERGLSVSAYIRELIRADDAASSNDGGDIAPPVGMLGTGAEPSDTARHKREMVLQAFSEELERRRRIRTDFR